MSDEILMPDSYPDLRWQCSCGRFISESAIKEEDYFDPGSYYGVGTRTWYDCSRCGTVEREPWLSEVGTIVRKQ